MEGTRWSHCQFTAAECVCLCVCWQEKAASVAECQQTPSALCLCRRGRPASSLKLISCLSLSVHVNWMGVCVCVCCQWGISNQCFHTLVHRRGRRLVWAEHEAQFAAVSVFYSCCPKCSVSRRKLCVCVCLRVCVEADFLDLIILIGINVWLQGVCFSHWWMAGVWVLCF